MAAKKSPKKSARPTKKAPAVKADKPRPSQSAAPRPAVRRSEPAIDPIREALSGLRDRGLSIQ